MKVMTVKDLQEYLKIGRDAAYKLMNTKGFPSYRIGKKMFVTDGALQEWINKTKVSDRNESN